MESHRLLIVNADDFGQSQGINQGVIEAHDHGIVTSASLMVRWPAAVEAAAMSKQRPQLSLGLHLDLGEWAYVDGQWRPVYEVVPLESARQIHAEVNRQLDEFHRLVGAAPTHLDTHQHVHRRQPVRSIMMEVAAAFKAPLREVDAQIQYCGRFYGQAEDGSTIPGAISVERLVDIVTTLPDGLTELCCHPAKQVDFDSMYSAERIQELAALTDPSIKKALAAAKVELCSFKTV